ncbi:MAG: hypothetical protein HUJ13_05060 [Hydrogenovibrio crunogenus]|nr:hypothetical protein [Hydrogenovibrio crunogenus]
MTTSQDANKTAPTTAQKNTANVSSNPQAETVKPNSSTQKVASKASVENAQTGGSQAQKPANKKTTAAKASSSKTVSNKTAPAKKTSTKSTASTPKAAESQHIADQIKVFSSRRVWPD